MLTYTTAAPDAQLMSSEAFRGLSNTLLYDPPIEEFSVLATTLKANSAERHPPIDGPSIVIVTDGKGTLDVGGEKSEVKDGSVWFVAAGQEVEFKSSAEGLVLYRAFVEV